MVLVQQHEISDERYPKGVGVDAETDEEAQLLQQEELEFEDSVQAYSGPKQSFWDRLGGPHPPNVQTVNPIFPSAQKPLFTFVERRLPGSFTKLVLLVSLLLLWLIIFIALLKSQAAITDGTGKPVINLDCIDTLWRPKNACGLDGIDCRPFENTSFAFRCPANCASVKVLNPRTVGQLDVNYHNLVIGNGTYRGDSFICGAAIHASVISDSKGGCGRIKLSGRHDNYPSVKRHGIKSIPFDSYFPLSLTISEDPSIRCPSDPRQSLLFVDVFFTTLLSVFGTSPAIFFLIFVIIFAHVGFISDPPSVLLADRVSLFAKRMLPAMFCAVVTYRTTIKRTLANLKAPIEKTLLWLGGFFFGALSNYTFDWIPIQRLTAHDLQQQPGAKVALAVILIILVVIVVGQAYCFWLEGRLLRYLALYGVFLLGIFICLIIPGVSLRIHHYILALLLLPGTSVQTRLSLLYQGILLGLFVNGIARWDFDSILQTPGALRQDGKFESEIPTILEPEISTVIDRWVARFTWATQPLTVDGISVLVNDVERYRGFFRDGIDNNHTDVFEWQRPVKFSLNEYIRFGFVRGGQALDYTDAGILFSNGTWTMAGTVRDKSLTF